MRSHALLEELQWRGLLYQQTEGLADLLTKEVVTGYVGFDPTAPSLHVGNLLVIMLLVHLQHAGHRPIALAGGGTGLIGDPSGRKSERQLLTPDVVASHTAGIAKQLARFLDFSGDRAAQVIDNAEWLTKLGAIEFMRDVGKHFTVNYMLQKESVKARMEEGISYTEFSYMLLQSYDYLELFRSHGVKLQMGGSDQWGNITAGVELIRRTMGGEAHALTAPLVTTSSGAKFGKSEGNAIWLDAQLTSPYQFYQFWMHVDDRDVGRYLRYFTLLPRSEIESLDHATAEEPERRAAQQALARDVTARVHGTAALAAAEEVTEFFFGGRDPATLSAEAFELLRRESPYAEVSASEIAAADGDGTASAERFDVVKMLVAAGLADSNGAGRRLLQQGGVSVNRRKLGAEERTVVAAEVMLPGRHVLLGKGKREFAMVRVRGA
jgi:tyrosyl-tRNA synthetase